MKFGIYSSIADPPAGENLALRVDEVVAEAKLAERAGFDSCFFGEHHQDRDGFLPSRSSSPPLLPPRPRR